MIVIRNTQIKTTFPELSFREFQDCLNILGDEEKETLEKYLDLLARLGLPPEELSEITIDDLLPFVEVFGKDKLEKTIIPKEIEIDSVIYSIYNSETYKISIKDLWQIEKQIKKDGKIDLIKAISIIAKQKDIESKWHYNDAHLFNKAKIFEEQSVSIFLPLIFHLSIELGEKILKLHEKQTSLL
jgi:hypothetical protein